MPSNCHCCWFAVASAPLAHTHTHTHSTFTLFRTVIAFCSKACHILCLCECECVEFPFNTNCRISTLCNWTRYVALLSIAIPSIWYHIQITLWALWVRESVCVCFGGWDVFIMSAWNKFIHAFYEWRNPNIKEIKRKKIIHNLLHICRICLLNREHFQSKNWKECWTIVPEAREWSTLAKHHIKWKLFLWDYIASYLITYHPFAFSAFEKGTWWNGSCVSKLWYCVAMCISL